MAAIIVDSVANVAHRIILARLRVFLARGVDMRRWKYSFLTGTVLRQCPFRLQDVFSHCCIWPLRYSLCSAWSPGYLPGRLDDCAKHRGIGVSAAAVRETSDSWYRRLIGAVWRGVASLVAVGVPRGLCLSAVQMLICVLLCLAEHHLFCLSTLMARPVVFRAQE